jgi:4'-phosphopantetheinyl transferase EntD
VHALIAGILAPEVASTEVRGESPDRTDGPAEGLFPAEQAALGRVAECRRRDFTVARACARRALGQLGLPPAAILPGPRREPCWPSGVVGSITHCPGYRAAAVARRARLASVGIDAEVAEALPEGVLDKVTLPEERSWMRVLSGTGVAWDRVVFSAKESVYKAWFPLARRWLGFEDAVVTVDLFARTFEARLLVDGPEVGGEPLSHLAGRFRVGDGLILTSVAVPWPQGAPA